jgi:Universal stress protein family
MSAVVIVAIAVGAAVLASALTLAVRRRRPQRLTPAPNRVLFPFFGESLSQSALDAALRLCRADDATLVPAYLAEVPLSLPLDAPLPRQATQALPVLEAVEQRALSSGVPVDSRIERGRDFRHALLELIDHEHYDRIVAAAAARNGDGFDAEDIAWLLDHAPGEIVILRAGKRG